MGYSSLASQTSNRLLVVHLARGARLCFLVGVLFSGLFVLSYVFMFVLVLFF